MDRELFDAAVKARERAHAPYSGYPVGVALRTKGGLICAGCNVENASYPEGCCAETGAISVMIAAAGSPEDRRIAEIMVVAEPIAGRLTTPCGGCRQRLAEFAGPDTPVTAADPAGSRSQTYTLGELLPAGFAMSGTP